MIKYAEQLPPSCPPADACEDGYESLFRLLTGGEARTEEFYSHAKLQKPNRGRADACRFASCSLLTDYKKYLDDFPGLKKSHTHVAKLVIPAGSGSSKPNKSGVHVDFWCFATTDLADYVVEIIPLTGEE